MVTRRTQGPGPCASPTRARCDINRSGPADVGLCFVSEQRRGSAVEAGGGELELIGGSFAVQTDKWQASCFPLCDARDPAPPPLLLATVSRKCLPSMLSLLRVNKLFYSLSGLRGREGGWEGGGEEGKVLWGHKERERERGNEREREVKSVLRNVPGQAWG